MSHHWLLLNFPSRNLVIIPDRVVAVVVTNTISDARLVDVIWSETHWRDPQTGHDHWKEGVSPAWKFPGRM